MVSRNDGCLDDRFDSKFDQIREYIKSSQFAKAKEAIDMLEQQRDLESKVQDEIFLLRAQLANKMGRFQDSLRILKNLSEHFAFSSQTRQYFELLNLLGDNYFQLGNFSEALGYVQEGLDLLRENSKLDDRIRKNLLMDLILIKVGIFWQTGKIDLAINLLEKTFPNYKDTEEISNQIRILKRLGILHSIKGNFEKGLNFLDEALKKALEAQNSSQIASLYNNIALVYSQMGNLSDALSQCEKSLVYETQMGNVYKQAKVLDSIGKIYHQMGQYDEATEYYLKSLKFSRKIANPHDMSVILFHLIENYLDMDQVDKCKKYLTEFEMLCLVDDNPSIFQHFQIIQALIWKRSPQLRHQFQAHEILQSIAFGPMINYEVTLSALLNLADLLYNEMRVTMKPEILEELESVMAELENIAESQHLVLLHAQTYLIKARFALLALNFDQARNYLTKAQNYAMNHQLDRIAVQIAAEHDKLLEKQSLIQHIEKNRINRAVLQNLLGIDLEFPRILKNQNLDSNLPNQEIPIFFSILNENGPLIFSQQFNPQIVVNDQLFGGLLSAFYSYCAEMTEHKFDRAKFGRYTIMLIPKSPLIFAYIYIGSSYSAKKRLTILIDKIEQNQELWEKIQNSVNSNNVMNKYTLQRFLNIFHSAFPEILKQES